MADLIPSDDFKRARDARIKSPEGKRALDDFAGVIMDWAIDAMPPDMRKVLRTPEGIDELMKLWPVIVDGYFRAICGPRTTPKRKPKKAETWAATAAQLVDETQKRVSLRCEW
jgi:hypothetical protein